MRNFGINDVDIVQVKNEGKYIFNSFYDFIDVVRDKMGDDAAQYCMERLENRNYINKWRRKASKMISTIRHYDNEIKERNNIIAELKDQIVKLNYEKQKYKSLLNRK